ncbi:hypothetical protein AB9F45_26050 [Rhizobium leguminosarum]|uniref:hypothetical protein n=1 Tax=Rhizobium leguminosarum TaxID=384 RepID=UPI003F9C88E0
MTAREPILSLDEYRNQHGEAEARLRMYVVSAWGEGKLSTDILTRLERRKAHLGFAINMHSRIAFAEAAAPKLDSYLRDHEIRQVWFVDLVSDQFIYPLAHANRIKFEELKSWVKKQLPGCNYLGGIDAGYYLNGSVVTGTREPAICWHAHLMVWGVSEQKLARLAARTNSRYRAGWEGATAFFFREWDSSRAVGRAMYALKAPLSEYIAYPSRGDQSDAKTGEISNATYTQKKRLMRRNHAVDVVQLYGEASLKDMILRAREGKQLFRQISFEASWSTAMDSARSVRQKMRILGIDPNMFS